MLYMDTKHKDTLIRYITANGSPAVRREWSGWKAGLPNRGEVRSSLRAVTSSDGESDKLATTDDT